MTGKQRLILEYVQAHEKNRGRPPSYLRIADAVGLPSRAAVVRHVRSLRTAGLVRTEGADVALTEEGALALAEKEPV